MLFVCVGVGLVLFVVDVLWLVKLSVGLVWFGGHFVVEVVGFGVGFVLLLWLNVGLV